MSPFIIGNIQFTFSLIVYALLARVYVWPSLNNKSFEKAVLPLLFIHVFRYGPLTLLMPGQVAPQLPMNVKEAIAYGDLVSAVFALVAIVLIVFEISKGRGPVWLFSIVGIADVAIASFMGIQAGAMDMPMGFNLYILNFYVPMLIVSHILIIRLLLKKAG